MDDDSLLALLGELKARDYHFVTPTPETHRRVIEGRGEGRDLRDIFGWSLPFTPEVLPPGLFERLRDGGLFDQEDDDRFRSRARVSSLRRSLFLHSAYPTDGRDAVFFGPDTYRFARFLRTSLAGRPPAKRVVDIGAGSGAGAIVAGMEGWAEKLTLADLNPEALHFARINARHAGVDVETVEGSGLDAVKGEFDLAITNPPYIVDSAQRTYRDGGGGLGAGLSLAWALEAAARVRPGGLVLLYTGSAIVAGEDRLEAALRAGLPTGCTLAYEELDPDVFGEELSEPPYRGVERIAAVGAVIQKEA